MVCLLLLLIVDVDVLETIAAGGRKWNSEREVLPERYPDAWTDEPQDAASQGWWRRVVGVRRTGLRQGRLQCHPLVHVSPIMSDFISTTMQ